MRALILERNKRVRRRLVRYFMCSGYKVMAVDEPALFFENLEGVSLVAADSFDGDLIVRVLADHPEIHGMLWTAEPLQRSLRYMIDMPRISNICGRKDFDSPPRDWEVLMVTRRLFGSGLPRSSFAHFLDWGFTGFEERIVGTEHRDAIVAKVQRFVMRLGTPRRVSDVFGELAHELIMNALFDAPVDEDGTPKYAENRKAQLVLPSDEQPLFRLASDGSRIVVQVIDPFGRLQRHHVFAGLARTLASGEMDASHGGAGLGLAMCHNATAAMFYDVIAGQKTEVTAIFDLEWNFRDLRSQAKSLHYFET